jgi:sugar lactone lactonase YvrE
VVAVTLLFTADGLTVVATAATPGSLVWASRYNGPQGLIDGAQADAVSPDGATVFVTGYVDSFAGVDFGTVAYDASTGVVRWTRRYDGPVSSSDRAEAIAVSPDGTTVFVTGTSDSTTRFDYATLAYDASSGATLWARRYNGPGDSYDEPAALGVSPDGDTVVVTGYSYGSTNGRDYATVAYAASTGTRSWVMRYDPKEMDDVATALAMSPDGSTVFVSGYSHRRSTSYDFATVAYGIDTGAEGWAKRYTDLNSWDEARSIGVAPDGSTVFVTGMSSSSDAGFDYATVAYDASTGARRWSKLYNGPGNANDRPNALAVSPDGSSIIVTGHAYSSTTGDDYATISYDASTGARRWVRRYVGAASTSSDEARDVGVSLDGSTVIVTGYSYGSTTSNDVATVAYEAGGGSTLWAETYDGPGNSDDVAEALDVSATSVFVTGSGVGTASSYDWATIAYALM